MHLFVLIQVLLQLDGSQHAPSGKLVESVMSCVENKVFLLHWDFLSRTSLSDNDFEFLLEVALVEINKRCKVVEVTQVLGVKNLVFVVLHDLLLLFWAKLTDLGEELLALLLLYLELAVLHIKLEDTVDVSGVELGNKLVHSVASDEGNVTVLAAEESEGLLYLFFDLCNL